MSSASSVKSSQTHFNGQDGWNDLGDMSNHASRRATPIDTKENEDYVMVDINKDQVMTEMTRLLAADSTLPPREHKHYEQKLLKLLPSLEPHYGIILDTVAKALDQQNPAEAKTSLVEYSLTATDCASFVLPIRRLVESLVV